ncbi:MAG: NADPH-dependent FMN reductase [Actinomycetota bacterium]|jgi:FMN reductase
MSTTPHIVGLGGSLGERSASRHALAVALAGAEEAGATTELLDVGRLELPFYGPGVRPTPGVARLVDATAAADGLIWSSPLYHGTVSGVFKNALDWLQLLAERDVPYLSTKPVGLIATAGGAQALQAINTMEFVVRALRGWTVPFVVPVPRAWAAFDDDGTPRDPALAAQLAKLGAEVSGAALRFAA